jgi:hypothetical protein
MENKAMVGFSSALYQSLETQSWELPEDTVLTHSNIKSRRLRWAGHVACTGKGGAYRVLAWKPEGRRPLGRPMYRWEDNIKMHL